MPKYEYTVRQSNPEDLVRIERRNGVNEWITIAKIADHRGARRNNYVWMCPKCSRTWLREVCVDGNFQPRVATGPCCGEPQLLWNYPGKTIQMLPDIILYAELVQYYLPKIGWRRGFDEWQEMEHRRSLGQ